MGTEGRRPDPPLNEELFEHPYRFEFFQAVRLLELLQEDRAPVGYDRRPRDEVVRFVARLGLEFPASAVHRLTPPRDGAEPSADPMNTVGGPPRMTTSFIGLVGPMGTLPRVYTEFLMRLRQEGDRATLAFLDLFHHRVVSLFYRAWEKYRFVRGWEARQVSLTRRSNALPDRARQDSDPFTSVLLHLQGLGPEPFRDRLGVGDETLAFYTGLFGRRQRPAVGLRAMLEEVFGHRVQVVQFVGQWLKMEPEQQSRMGASGAHNQLGTSLVVGARAWDHQGKFRVRIGPLRFGDYRAFLPDGPLFLRLVELVRLYVGSELAFDVQLVLKASEAPPCRAGGTGVQLGRSAWSRGRELERDPDQAIFAAPL